MARPLLSNLLRATTLGLLASVGLTLACIPSFPPCNCSTAEGELDRSEPCIEGLPLPGDDPDAACGYPAGPYGVTLDATFPNLEMFDCEGNSVQIAQYLPQEGLPGVDTSGLVLGIGALWCQPCQIEGMEWAAGPVDDYAGDIQFLQALDQGSSPSEPMSTQGCMGWSANVANDTFPILWVDTPGALQAQIQTQPNDPLPYTVIIDANAHVRFRRVGMVVDPEILTATLDAIVNDPYGN